MRKVKKAKLYEAVNTRKDKTERVLELIKSELNQGQFKKLIKNDEVREFFELYCITDE